MGSPGLFDGLCELLYKEKKNTRKHYLNMAEKMLRNVSELMLASVSHYEILDFVCLVLNDASTLVGH